MATTHAKNSLTPPQPSHADSPSPASSQPTAASCHPLSRPTTPHPSTLTAYGAQAGAAAPPGAQPGASHKSLRSALSAALAHNRMILQRHSMRMLAHSQTSYRPDQPFSLKRSCWEGHGGGYGEHGHGGGNRGSNADSGEHAEARDEEGSYTVLNYGGGYGGGHGEGHDEGYGVEEGSFEVVKDSVGSSTRSETVLTVQERLQAERDVQQVRLRAEWDRQARGNHTNHNSNSNGGCKQEAKEEAPVDASPPLGAAATADSFENPPTQHLQYTGTPDALQCDLQQQHFALASSDAEMAWQGVMPSCEGTAEWGFKVP
ncbi:unnamed protein product [Closterium sp. Yama58-4]|nr:unnamed protein product [Closterium sp. Yama58-4]